MRRPTPLICFAIVLRSSRAPLLQRRPPATPSISSPAHSSGFSGERVEFEWEQEGRNETREERRRGKARERVRGGPRWKKGGGRLDLFVAGLKCSFTYSFSFANSALTAGCIGNLVRWWWGFNLKVCSAWRTPLSENWTIELFRVFLAVA